MEIIHCRIGGAYAGPPCATDHSDEQNRGREAVVKGPARKESIYLHDALELAARTVISAIPGMHSVCRCERQHLVKSWSYLVARAAEFGP